MRYTMKNTIEVGVLVDIWLDGVPMSEVVEADTDEGYIVRIKRDKDGDIVVNGDYIEHERIDGEVRVQVRDRLMEQKSASELQ